MACAGCPGTGWFWDWSRFFESKPKENEPMPMTADQQFQVAKAMYTAIDGAHTAQNDVRVMLRLFEGLMAARAAQSAVPADELFASAKRMFEAARDINLVDDLKNVMAFFNTIAGLGAGTAAMPPAGIRR